MMIITIVMNSKVARMGIINVTIWLIFFERVGVPVEDSLDLPVFLCERLDLLLAENEHTGMLNL